GLILAAVLFLPAPVHAFPHLPPPYLHSNSSMSKSFSLHQEIKALTRPSYLHPIYEPSASEPELFHWRATLDHDLQGRDGRGGCVDVAGNGASDPFPSLV
ncbi:hypothetical protein C8R47DRAFT_1152360, partial [Mycena vitilis]